jgi:hypothetical protein
VATLQRWSWSRDLRSWSRSWSSKIGLDRSPAQCTNMVSLLRDFDLVQHTTGPTHNKGHTLDVFITHRTASVSVCVDPPVMSDHSLITGQFSVNAVYSTDDKPIMKRRWNTFDVDAFKQDLPSTDLVVNPPANYTPTSRCVTTVHFGSFWIDMHHSAQRDAVFVLFQHGTTKSVITSRARHADRKRSTVRLLPPRRVVMGKNSSPNSVVLSI